MNSGVQSTLLTLLDRNHTQRAGLAVGLQLSNQGWGQVGCVTLKSALAPALPPPHGLRLGLDHALVPTCFIF